MTLLLSSCSSINKYFGLEDDNLAEEASEALIEWKTGIDIDLTPSTPEK
jgi:hypothetical protein